MASAAGKLFWQLLMLSPLFEFVCMYVYVCMYACKYECMYDLIASVMLLRNPCCLLAKSFLKSFVELFVESLV